MPKPVLLIPCIHCASPHLLDLARKREQLELPVEYGICSAHRTEKDLDRFPPPK
jgi:hypothetical protein